MQVVDMPQGMQHPTPPSRTRWRTSPGIEGRVYPTLQAKQDALEPILKAW